MFFFLFFIWFFSIINEETCIFIKFTELGVLIRIFCLWIFSWDTDEMNHFGDGVMFTVLHSRRQVQ